jgi:predicted nuclease of restriction endonuclease-like (RecB) superfamily
MADLISTSKSYQDLLARLKSQIQTAQVRAALAVNQELVLLYWQIGKEILTRQEVEGWGSKVIERLAKDLHVEFPEMKGLSPRNLKYMRAFAEAWAIVQQPVAQLPWGHNVRLLDLTKSADERLWYAEQAIRNGWSRNVLVMQIESGLFRRQGKAITNFRRLCRLRSPILLNRFSKIHTTSTFSHSLRRPASAISNTDFWRICVSFSSNSA